ncbi:polysaccharide deacetylase family protein [Ruminococcus sp. FC2018]|uniref:polysaccharide deacetylase family protein n=1 Tax=Ruminococcus sp. FC2018 TaxID=1410617 RepID=UPI0004904BCD|nr:polysaccharide deacetylase family protein [Ruminococcus sp. FC2018]
MNIHKHLKISNLLKIFAVIAVYICTMVLLRSDVSAQGTTSAQSVVILRYNSIDQGDGTVSVESFEQDVRYLTNMGYTPVFVSDIAKALKDGGELPKKSVALLIDGYSAGCSGKVGEIIEQYCFKATVCVYGKQTEYSSNSADTGEKYLRWSEITDLNQKDCFEFANGGFSLLQDKSAIQREGEDFDSYRSRMIRDIYDMQQLFIENCGFEPVIFTFAQGCENDSLIRILGHSDFLGAVGTQEGSIELYGKNRSQRRYMKCIKRNKDDEIEDIIK